MAFSAQMSREHQLWSLHDLSDQVKARDTGGQKQFARALRSLSHHPVDVPDDLYHVVERKGMLLVQANTTRLDTSLVYQHELHGIKLYEKTSRDDHNSVLVVQGVSAVAGSVASILRTFNMHTSKTFTTTMQALLPSIVCQGATVATDNDGTNVHWMSVVGLHDDHRLSDVLFVSSSQLYAAPSADECEDDAGDDLALVSTNSTENAACGTHIWESVGLTSPALQHLALFGPTDTKCARLNVVNSGFFVEPTDVDDVCRVSFSFSCHVQAGVDAKARHWMEGVVVTGLQQLAATCRTTHLQLVPRQKWAEANHCHLCTKSFRFNMLRRRHHCRLCGHSICSACSTFVTLETLDDPSLGHRRNSAKVANVDSVRSCLLCAFAEKSTKAPLNKAPSTAPSTSSTGTRASIVSHGSSSSSLTSKSHHELASKPARVSSQRQHSQRVPSASRASLAPTATTTGSSFRDSFATRVSSTHDSFPSSPARQGSWMRTSLGQYVMDPADLAPKAPHPAADDGAASSYPDDLSATPQCVQSPMIHSRHSRIELTRHASLDGRSSHSTSSMVRNRRRSLQADAVVPGRDVAGLRSAVGDSLTMSCYGDVRMSERHARRAAMLERSNSYLEMAMLKPTTPTRGSETSTRLPAELLLLQEFGLTQLSAVPSSKTEHRSTAAPMA